MAAVRTAVHPGSPGRGVRRAVGEGVHAAAEATKWHTQSLSAFRSAHGPLGVVDRGQIVYHRPPFRRPALGAARLVSEVDLHTMAAGTDDSLSGRHSPAAPRLVLEAPVAATCRPPCARLRAASLPKPPCAVSRCAKARLPLYGYECASHAPVDGRRLRSRPPRPKARIKLMVALGLTSDPAEIRRIFADGAAGS